MRLAWRPYDFDGSQLDQGGTRQRVTLQLEADDMPRLRGLRFGLLAGVLAAPPLPAQVARLTVVDSLTKDGVPDAIVTIVDRAGNIAGSGRTRGGGTFQLKLPAAGTYSYFVRRLGFSPAVSDAFEVAAADTARVTLPMRRIPQFLTEVAIRSERETIRNESFFGMKIGTMSATVISPTQVDRGILGANDFTDIIGRNPGAAYQVDRERRCVLGMRGYPPGCLPVIVDGVLTGNSADVVPPEIVDYIIIVRGNELGVMYGSIGLDGAVLVFTKRGLRRGPQAHP